MAETRGDRLKAARAKLYPSARSAAIDQGWPVSTYGAHERAETPGGRDYGPDEAKVYGRRFRVAPEWLLTGAGPGPGASPAPEEPDEIPSERKARVVGYVGAGDKAHFYEVAPGDLDEVPAPAVGSENTVAVEIRGTSLGEFFDRAIAFYDDVHRPATADLVGRLCVVGLTDGRVLIKKLRRGKKAGRFDLISHAGEPIRDVEVAWAARVIDVRLPK